MEEERRTEELTEVWERSVKATHSFLPDTAREELKKIVQGLLAEVPHLVAAEDDRGALAGFMGLDGQELEMLFLAPEVRKLTKEFMDPGNGYLDKKEKKDG